MRKLLTFSASIIFSAGALSAPTIYKCELEEGGDLMAGMCKKSKAFCQNEFQIDYSTQKAEELLVLAGGKLVAHNIKSVSPSEIVLWRKTSSMLGQDGSVIYTSQLITNINRETGEIVQRFEYINGQGNAMSESELKPEMYIGGKAVSLGSATMPRGGKCVVTQGN